MKGLGREKTPKGRTGMIPVAPLSPKCGTGTLRGLSIPFPIPEQLPGHSGLEVLPELPGIWGALALPSRKSQLRIKLSLTLSSFKYQLKLPLESKLPQLS